MFTFAAATKATSTIAIRAPAQSRVDHFVAITCSDPNDSCDLYNDACRTLTQLVSPSRDPIGFEGSPWNTYKTFFVPSATDPDGQIVPVLIGIGVGIGIFLSPNIANAPGPSEPVYPGSGPLGTEPENAIIGGVIGAGVGGIGLAGKKCCSFALKQYLKRQIAAIQAQIQAIENLLAIYRQNLADCARDLAKYPYGSTKWNSAVENIRLLESRIRALETTLRRLKNELQPLLDMLINVCL